MSSRSHKSKKTMRREGDSEVGRDGMRKGSRAQGRAKVKTKEAKRDRVFVLTVAHLQCVVMMGLIFVVGSVIFPRIDRTTLKPDETFPTWLKKLSSAVNVPIKLGVFHMCFYGIELFRDEDIFAFHTGQRLTTLWFQFLQHRRWGQHLHMQTETLLQIVDVAQSGAFSSYSIPEKAVLAAGACMLCLTNLITSIAYHTWEEQAIGYLLTLAKLFIDYGVGHEVNRTVGRSLRSWRAVFGGVVTVAIVVVLSKVAVSTELSEAIVEFMLHPTVLATSVFAAGFLYHHAHRVLW